MFDLRAWLRRAPKPRKLRIHVDGDERIIDLGAGRCKWVEVEETVRNAGATLVECLAADLSILRSTVLEEDVEKEDPATATSTAMAKAQAGSAAMLDAYGRRMNEAFLAGASAANTSQENLVAIVETLSAHLSLAITNLHNVSTNMATMAQQYADAVATSSNGDGEGKSDKMLGLLTAMITSRGGLAAAPAATNGKGKAST